MRYGVIMAGGSGTRLWPLSRANKPKQLLPVVGGKSLLAISFDRLLGVLPPERIFVCTAAAHAEAVFAALPQLPRQNLLGEPVGRDTANAVGFSAAVLRRRDPDAVAAVVTADHVIEPVDRFQAVLRSAFELAEEQPDVLVTFGVVATFGHTGLGYIHRGEKLQTRGAIPGAYRVQAFKEKPDRPTADRYVESARYYWNSGMFVWRCDTVLGELAVHLPASHGGLARVAEAWDTPRRQQVLEEVYPLLPKIAIDFAVMEPASHGKGKARVVTVELPVQWLDIGSWPALAEIMPMDEQGNAVDARVTVLVDSDNNIIVSDDPEHLVAAVGVSDAIIVHTRDVTMVCPRQDAQRVRDLAAKVRDRAGEKYA